MTVYKEIKPNYSELMEEAYYNGLMFEYQQCVEEGLNIAPYKDLFEAVYAMPNGEQKKKMADVLFEVLCDCDMVEGYPYKEPSQLEEIKKLRKGNWEGVKETLEPGALEDKIQGAWLGRICGCLLGKTVEGIHSDELIPFLQETGNYPLHRYITREDVREEVVNKYKFWFHLRECAGDVVGMPADDDTNYMIIAQEVIEKFGRDFTSKNMADFWLMAQGKDACFTAERVAYYNFIRGYEPPQSAMFQNPYREWIGAQIRGDYFGYINPGNPELAAEMAFRDASISHVKNGIYGEMFVVAMLSCAAVTDDIKEIILGGLAQIPYTSRLYEAIMGVVNAYEAGVTLEDVMQDINNKYDQYTVYGWCHTIPNAMIVVACLLYGKGDYGKSICMAVEAAFDTDCNGATVGSVLGMAYGTKCIDPVWLEPIQNTLHTSIFGVGTVKITDRVKKTIEHIK